MQESIFSFLYLLPCFSRLKQISLSYFKRKWNRYNQRNRTRIFIYCSLYSNFDVTGQKTIGQLPAFPLLGQGESGSDISFKRKLHHEEKSLSNFSFAITIRRIKTFYTYKNPTTDILCTSTYKQTFNLKMCFFFF